MYELCRGVRIFKNITGVQIRTLVYEKKNLVRGLITTSRALNLAHRYQISTPRGTYFENQYRNLPSTENNFQMYEIDSKRPKIDSQRSLNRLPCTQNGLSEAKNRYSVREIVPRRPKTNSQGLKSHSRESTNPQNNTQLPKI